MTKVIAKDGSIAAGNDININLTIVNGKVDDVKLFDRVSIILGISVEELKSIVVDTSNIAVIGDLIRSTVFQQNVHALVDTGKFADISRQMNQGVAQITEIKDKGFEAESAIREGNYKAAHAAIGCIINSVVLPIKVRQQFTYEFFLTGFLHLANIGNSAQVTNLYHRAQSDFAQDLDPKLLCLLEEMQQEVATREISDKPLEENLSSLEALLSRNDLTSSDRRHALMLKALCLRRLGERERTALLLESIALHEDLLQDGSDRVIEITNNYAIALIRCFEVTRELKYLNIAGSVLGRLTPPKDGILISEYQCYPKVLNNLGNVSKQFIRVSTDSHHLSEALERYSEAEKYWNEQNAPYEWAMLQKNKAEAKLFYMQSFGAVPSLRAQALVEIERSLKHRTIDESSWQNRKSDSIKTQLLSLSTSMKPVKQAEA
jgi:hypothetical protein